MAPEDLQATPVAIRTRIATAEFDERHGPGNAKPQPAELLEQNAARAQLGWLPFATPVLDATVS